MSTNINLYGKIALVTGGGRGIAKAITRRLAEAGASVVIAGRKLENLEATAKEFASLPGKVVPIACHVGQKDQIENLVRETEARTIAGLIMITRSWAQEFGPHNIRVNAIAPGLIQTDLSEFYWKDDTRRCRYESGTPLHRIGQPDEIAGLVLYLASDEASFITGQMMAAV